MTTQYDMGGIDLTVNSVSVGASTPGATGTSLSGSELIVLDSVTAGTVAASKALVVDSSKNIGTLGNVTMTKAILASGGYIDLDSATATLSSNAATVTKYAVVVTTESLTTAAGASQALVITLSGVAAGDLVFLTRAGGTNTRHNFSYDAVTTTNTVTVTVYNTEPVNALNGTLIFNMIVAKA